MTTHPARSPLPPPSLARRARRAGVRTNTRARAHKQQAAQTAGRGLLRWREPPSLAGAGPAPTHL